MLVKAILLGCVAGFALLDGRMFGEMKFREPLVTSFLVGLILGDVRKGLIIGAQLQLTWMGITGIGLSPALDIETGGTIGTAFALLTGSGVEVALTLALPVAVLMQFFKSTLVAFLSVFMHKADQYAAKADMKGMVRLHYTAILIYFLLAAAPTFLAIYFGQEAVANIVNNLPAFITAGLTTVSHLLPALGFAMLLQILLEIKLIPFFVIGFVLAVYLGMDMVSITLIAAALAGIMFILRSEMAKSEEESL